MLLNIIDGLGTPQVVVTQSQDTPTDRSGVIEASDAPTTVMTENSARSGWLVQNRGLSNMWINDIGGDASEDDEASFLLKPGMSFPPPGYPVTTGIITIAGDEDEPFAAREW
jgi:hypothetical protein